MAHLLTGTAARPAGLHHPSISLTRELVPLAERMMYPPIRPLLMVTLSPLLKGNVLGEDCIQIWPLANRNIMRCLDPDRIATISVSTSGWLFQSNKPPRDNFFLASCVDSSATITLFTGSAARTAVDWDAFAEDCGFVDGSMSLGNSRSKHSSRSALSTICEHWDVCSA